MSHATLLFLSIVASWILSETAVSITQPFLYESMMKESKQRKSGTISGPPSLSHDLDTSILRGNLNCSLVTPSAGADSLERPELFRGQG